MEGTLQEISARWMGVVKSAQIEALLPKLQRKLEKKSMSYQDFVAYLVNETGIKDGIIRGGIKVFLPQEGLPNPDRFVIFRKFEDITGGQRTCYVRNPKEADYPTIETETDPQQVTI